MLWYCNMSDLKFRPYKEHHTGLELSTVDVKKCFQNCLLFHHSTVFNSVHHCTVSQFSRNAFLPFGRFRSRPQWKHFVLTYTDIFCECGTHRSLVHYSPIMVVHVVNKYIFWKFRRQGKLIRCVLTLKSS